MIAFLPKGEKIMDKNSLGYIRIAMLRNEKLNAMHFTGLDKDRFSWFELNKELVRIEGGMLASLKNMKPQNRDTLYENVVEAQRNAEFEVYKLNLSKHKTNDDLKALTDATRIKEATDYLELLLQIHFPQQFPNPLVEEVLGLMQGDKDPSEGAQQVPYSDTYTQIVMGLAESRGERIEDFNYLTDGSVSEEQRDDFAETNGSTDTVLEEVEASLTDYQPKAISLFEKYKESQLLTGTSLQGSSVVTLENNQIIDNGPVQE